MRKVTFKLETRIPNDPIFIGRKDKDGNCKWFKDPNDGIQLSPGKFLIMSREKTSLGLPEWIGDIYLDYNIIEIRHEHYRITREG